jgi:hypothetical protein
VISETHSHKKWWIRDFKEVVAKSLDAAEVQ